MTKNLDRHPRGGPKNSPVKSLTKCFVASWLLMGCGTTVMQFEDAAQDIGDVEQVDSGAFDAVTDSSSRRDAHDAALDSDLSRDVHDSDESADILQINDADAADIFDVISIDRPNDTGSCRADSMALFCGVNNCNVCTAPAHAVAHCNGDSCATDLQCEAGFDDCDHSQNNGCEISLQTDITNCGRCGVICSAPAHARPTCNNGGSCDFECAGGWVRSGAVCVVPPVGLRRPLSSTVLVGDRPLYRWAPLEAAEAYRIEICRTRECVGADIVETAIVRGANVYQQQNYRLDSRIHFWRVHALVGGVTQSSSATWEFRSINPRDPTFPAKQRYSTLLDANGNGREEVLYDGVVAVAGRMTPTCEMLEWNPLANRAEVPIRVLQPQAETWTCVVRRLGDVTGDGLSDWVSVPVQVDGVLVNSPVFYQGNSDFQSMLLQGRAFAPTSPFLGWVGDVNDDGYQDSIENARNGGLRRIELRLGSPTGLAANPIALTNWGSVEHLRVLEDYDGDGRPELLLGENFVATTIANWNGIQLNPAPFADASVRPPIYHPLGDVNGDGLTDTFRGVGGEQVILLSARDGTSSQALQIDCPLTGSVNFKGINPAGDINDDGLEDAFAYGRIDNHWQFDVFLGSRDTEQLRVSDYSLRGSSDNISIVGTMYVGSAFSLIDLRGDGRPYIAIGKYEYSIALYQFSAIPPNGNNSLAEILYSVPYPDRNLRPGGFLTLAPALTAPRYTIPSLYPSMRFLLPSQQPPRALPFLFSHSLNPSSIGQTMGDYS